MKRLTLPIHPKEITARSLKTLPSPRLREVLERRFGLRGKDAETLEVIGTSFGVTRERVRQIQAEGMKHLSRPAAVEVFRPVFASLEEHFKEHGHVFEESKLLNSITEPRFHNHVYFLLTVGAPFKNEAEDESWHERWFTKDEALRAAESVIARTADEIGSIRKPISATDLFQILKSHSRAVLGSVPSPETLESYLALSRLIKQNPYGEFGLVTWPTIRPRGVRDKAFAVLAKSGKPLHFREVASAISKAGWSSRRAHAQTVHNELIKDSRFVLVGRGLYGLTEWGYEPGTVSDVMVSLLKSAKKPLPRDEIVKRVLQQRFVKPTTVLLNLQNKSLFKRMSEGYTVV